MNPTKAVLRTLIEQARDAATESDEVQFVRASVEDELIRHPPEVDEALNRLQHNETGDVGPLFLPATEHCVPVFKCSWGFADAADVLKLRVLLYRLPPHGAGDLLVAAGFRYETPDQDPEEDHHLHHVQPIVSLDGASGPPAAGVHVHTMVEQPTIPLPARNSTGLLVCLLMSLYGRRAVKDRANRMGQTLNAAIREVEVGAYIIACGAPR